MPTSIHDILDELYASSTDERDKGDKFERLMATYLRIDVTWSDRFSNVWLWGEWPGRHGKPDTGIDLVAEERETGGLTAIQCKFYDPAHRLEKSDIDSFFTASGKEAFTGRMIVSTTDKWSRHAEDALEGQHVPVTRLRVQDLDESSIDWSRFSLRTPEVMQRKDKKTLFPHQHRALADVRDGFQDRARGKLIMACGTGKTLTSLRIAEDLVASGGSVLFLVPSISLLSQTLREWTTQAQVPLRPFAVCSDTKVGKRTESEDISPYDLAVPPTTNAAKLYARLSGGQAPDKITVIFSTYQSLPVVTEAQQQGLSEFDLIICDEAHRTTGVTLAGEEESNFRQVHYETNVKAAKRLYMTATPRIYDDSSKSQANEGSAVLASMDDEQLYGPEFHRLGFGEAVGKGLLADYKVLVLAVDEQAVSATFQAQLADENSELRIDDAAKIVGCWNGLAKRGKAESGFGEDTRPMARAVAFARSIEDSEKFSRLFTGIVDTYVDTHDLTSDDDETTTSDRPLRCEAKHVDGTFNVLRRNEMLDWLKAPLEPGNCRILSNARCLSEGVDVPALDAVMFLNPRNSVVDVVQSVGRVMRKSSDSGKQYGYVILPIGIPADRSPEQALADNQKYKVVWQVLQALRAHDERFNAVINRIELNKTKTDKLQIIGVGDFADEHDQGATHGAQGTLEFPNIGEWRDALYVKIVKKVGDRRYWEDWAKDISRIAERHTTRIKALLGDPSLDVEHTFEDFLQGLRGNINDGITRDDAIDMLSQHLITKPVFDALFEGYSFADHNPVSRVMQNMLDALDEQNIAKETETLEKFYDSVRVRAEGIDNAEGKQKIITELYEKFFKIAFPRAAESLGIVYTPVQIVDFIIRSVESVLHTEFGASISDSGVHVLDPFTGTGTFITRLLQSGLIRPEDMAHKYAHELHANEILLLAYYIAAINIEATYHGIAGGDYVPFNGIVLTDTFQMTEDDDTMDAVIFPQNNERVAHQKNLDIRVIIGNPPYSAGQTSQNDDNQNQKYPTLDTSISRTYAARSTATNKNSLYDSYIRAIRWASNRIAASEHGGVICYVSNGGYIDSNTADGLRKTLADEFHSIYCFNLRGNTRTSGEQARREGGQTFGPGSRATVAILLLVKKPEPSTGAVIRYRDIGDYLTREEKLRTVADSALDNVEWQQVIANAEGDWINQRNISFEAFTPIGAKRSGEAAIFQNYSRGLATARDAWVYSYSRSIVQSRIRGMVEFYNSQVEDYLQLHHRESIIDPKKRVDSFIDLDPTKISWNRADKTNLARGVCYKFHKSAVMLGTYRPFNKQYVYFDRQLNDMVYQLPKIFPTTEHHNVGLYITGVGAMKSFSVIAVDHIPDLNLWGSEGGQFFPRYTYEQALGELDLFSDDIATRFTRLDNITDEILVDYRSTYSSAVSKDDIFYYVYALLHSPDYRTEFAADLKKMLPRIPKVDTAQDFKAYVAAGRQLADLHIGYESVESYLLGEIVRAGHEVTGTDFYRVQKMAFGKKGKAPDKSVIIYNSNVTLTGIPAEAYEYMLGSRSAVEWIMERYQVKTDKASGIVNDPNDWAAEVGDPRYILDLLKRIVTVSVETVKIVKNLPTLKLIN